MGKRRILSFALALLLVLTSAPGKVEAKKAPKLSNSKVKIQVGKTKKISIKNGTPKKLKWKASKKAKKIVKVKKVGKKIHIKGKKAGKATVKISFRVRGKKYTKKCKVTVTKAQKGATATPANKTGQPSSSPTGGAPTPSAGTTTDTPSGSPAAPSNSSVPSAVPDTPSGSPAEPSNSSVPSAAPETPEEPQVQELDLSVFDIQLESGGRPTYDESTKTIHAQNVEQFIVKLPEQINTGETVKFTIKGKNNGTVGFRVWLSDTNFSALSEQPKSTDYGVGSGEFTMEIELTSTGAATHILIKGPAYGTNMDDLEISSITAAYGKSSEATGPKNPYAPETEQAYDTSDLKLTTSFRNQNTVSSETVNSMLVAQRFIADPTTVEYNGRLYVYGTTDVAEFDGKGNVISNAYNTNTMSCISTSDMVNWKDEGVIDVTELTDYAKKSWAPSIVSKEIGGKTKFFLYYTLGGDGIGVLEADSPTGPWKDPIGKRLISRDTPTCSAEEVPWLFDPGVFVDDDGQAYIYFGGGNDSGVTNPTFGRIAKLGDDMTSLAETPREFAPYYYFEDNEINKFGDTYYYSYSTNWSTNLANNKDKYTGQACIAYYTADNPYMENATYHGTVFENPGNLYGHVYNNHHHMFTFKGQNYIAYHTTYLERVLYKSQMGYRNLHIDKLTVKEDGTISATPTYAGVGGTGSLTGTQRNSANIMSDNGGLTTEYSASKKDMVLTEIQTGDWNKVSGVDFGTGASGIDVEVCSDTDKGSIEVYVDGKPGETTAKKIATVKLENTSGNDTYKTLSASLDETVSGAHDLYFVYRGSGYQVAAWTLK